LAGLADEVETCMTETSKKRAMGSVKPLRLQLGEIYWFRWLRLGRIPFDMPVYGSETFPSLGCRCRCRHGLGSNRYVKDQFWNHDEHGHTRYEPTLESEVIPAGIQRPWPVHSRDNIASLAKHFPTWDHGRQHSPTGATMLPLSGILQAVGDTPHMLCS
jgi:hypothetical protein